MAGVRATLDRRAALRLGAGALAAAPFAAQAQLSGARRWTVTGTANTNSQGPQNPYYVLGKPEVQSLALAALEAPLSRAEVERAIRGTDVTVDNLVATDVLRRLPNGRYALDFNIVTREDMQLMRRVANPAGASLAAAILNERAEFEAAFARYDLPYVDQGLLAMALVGCVVLDWDGLDVTAEDGIRVPPVQKPNGDKYIMSMIETAPDISVRALYWGSHSEGATDRSVVLTTFGDHENPRRLGFPDLNSRVSTTNLEEFAPQDVARRLSSILHDGVESEQDEAGRIMLRLRDGPAPPEVLGGTVNTVPLLTALRYIQTMDGSCQAHIPVFTAARDGAMLEDVRARGRRIMRAWLRENYAPVRDALTWLRSVRAGVPYNVVFTQIWHDLFGWANYHLVQDGFLYDPYGPDAEWVSFAPFVWDASLNLYAGTRIF